MIRNSALMTLLFLLAPQVFPSDLKTDVVFLTNGDRVTGEVVRLEAGLLEFKTDTMGTTFIEWRFIADIISQHSHSVETVDGTRFLGQLQKPLETDHIQVETLNGPVSLTAEEVVAVWPVEATFWDKIRLDTSLGFNYTKSTDITDFTLAVDFQHVTTDRLSEASLRNDITVQSGDGNDQHRNEIRFAHQYLRPGQKFRTWMANLESNDAVGVDLRFSGGGGIGKYFVKTNTMWFALTGGVMATEERPNEGERETNLEAVGSLRYRYFRFADPERRFDTTFSVLPSLTDVGRVRADLRSTFRLEFFTDLFWSMELYATHDTDPLSEDAEKTDFGIVSSLGWTY